MFIKKNEEKALKEEALREIVREKMEEKRGAQLMWDTYHPPKSPAQLLQEEKLKLKKRIIQIENQEGLPEEKQKLLQQELARRRLSFHQLQYERQLNLQILNQNLSQESFVNPEGKLVFGIQ